MAAEFDISRRAQDQYAVESYWRAENAQKQGWFDDEIVPVTVKDKSGKESTIFKDEIRYGTTYERIAKLKPSFPDHGDTTHAGNSSQLTDGMRCLERGSSVHAEQLQVPRLCF